MQTIILFECLWLIDIKYDSLILWSLQRFPRKNLGSSLFPFIF